MAAHRGVDAMRLLCSGPARLTQALSIARADDGADLVGGAAIQLREGAPVPAARVVRTTRVGVRVGVEARWRYLERASPFASPGRPSGADGLGRIEAGRPADVTGSR
jgi:DNA-3-methyladenine glycosylase